MVFQGEDVPLTEDIIKRKIEFVKSWVEFQSDRALQILESGTNTLGAVTLYTVPKNKTFFLTSASIIVSNVSPNTTNTSIGLNSTRYGFIIRAHTQNPLGAIEAIHYGFSQTFPMLIKFEVGDSISITASNGLISASIQGFEIDKKIS